MQPKDGEWPAFDLGIMANPYPTYAAMRAEAPVHRVTLPTGAKVWLVTRYEDARVALNSPELSLDKKYSDGTWPGLGTPGVLQRNLLNMDPPDHTRIRRLVSAAFTARRIEAMRPSIHRTADELLDAIAGETQVDLIAAYAAQLPSRVFGNLLGVPAEMHEEFRSYNRAMLDSEATDRTALKVTVANLVELLHQLLSHKRNDLEDDLLSDLIRVRDAGDRLSEDELLSLVFLLILAGYESTVNSIGLSILTLLDHPAHVRALREDPGLYPAMVTELMRYTGSSQLSIRRFTKEAVKIGGTEIPAQQTVMVVLPSANHDPQRFADADTLDPGRADAAAGLGFGHGIHHCLGAPLARLEIEIALRCLFTRFPRLSLSVARKDLQWREMFRGRGVVRLPAILR